MAHFAKLDENNIVLEVNVVNNDNLLDSNGVEQEALGISYLVSWSGGYTNWKQTSYSGSFRKNYAGVGGVYDPQKDAFIPQKEFSSWVLNEETCLWEPPIPMPLNDKKYYWDEEQINWIEVTE
jgi:hypothetical protein